MQRCCFLGCETVWCQREYRPCLVSGTEFGEEYLDPQYFHLPVRPWQNLLAKRDQEIPASLLCRSNGRTVFILYGGQVAPKLNDGFCVKESGSAVALVAFARSAPCTCGKWEPRVEGSNKRTNVYFFKPTRYCFLHLFVKRQLQFWFGFMFIVKCFEQGCFLWKHFCVCVHVRV